MKHESKSVSEAKRNNTKKPMVLFEKILLASVIVFILSVIANGISGVGVSAYTVSVIIVILGLVLAIKPKIVIDVQRKQNDRFDELAKGRIGKMESSLRIIGIIFMIAGAILVLNLIYSEQILSFFKNR